MPYLDNFISANTIFSLIGLSIIYLTVLITAASFQKNGFLSENPPFPIILVIGFLLIIISVVFILELEQKLIGISLLFLTIGGVILFNINALYSARVEVIALQLLKDQKKLGSILLKFIDTVRSFPKENIVTLQKEISELTKDIQMVNTSFNKESLDSSNKQNAETKEMKSPGSHQMGSFTTQVKNPL